MSHMQSRRGTENATLSKRIQQLPLFCIYTELKFQKWYKKI